MGFLSHFVVKIDQGQLHLVEVEKNETTVKAIIPEESGATPGAGGGTDDK